MAGDAAGVRRLVDRPQTASGSGDADVVEALLEGLIAEAAKRGELDLSLVGVDSTTARAHHDAAGMHLDQGVVTALEKAGAEEGRAWSKGAASKNRTGRTPETIPRPPRTRPDAVAGDKAYSSRGNRTHLRRRGIEAVIPAGGRPVGHDARRL